MSRFVCIFFLLLIALAGCRRESTGHADERRVFDASGVIKEFQRDGKTVVVHHDAISNYMGAMTMPFAVHDAAELQGLKPGDAIRFKLVVTATDGWMESIHLQSNASATAPPAPKPAPSVRVVAEPLEIGQMVPDFHFVNQLGQAVHIGQYRGQVIAVTFFFTSCPFPTFCPRMTSNFSEVEQALEKSSNAPPRWHLLEISFDPVNDTPARLKTYADTAHYDFRHWSFLCGKPDEVLGLADRLGEIYEQQGGTITHNLRTAVIDAHGRLRKIFTGNEWTSQALADEMIQAGKLP